MAAAEGRADAQSGLQVVARRGQVAAAVHEVVDHSHRRNLPAAVPASRPGAKPVRQQRSGASLVGVRPPRPPLHALLSQLLVALTIEVDNTYERRAPHHTTKGGGVGPG